MLKRRMLPKLMNPQQRGQMPRRVTSRAEDSADLTSQLLLGGHVTVLLLLPLLSWEEQND